MARVFESSTKKPTRTPLLLVGIVLLLITPLFARPLDSSRTTTTTTPRSVPFSSPLRRALPESPTTQHAARAVDSVPQSTNSFSTTTTTVNATSSTTATKKRQFAADAHEVPSGPNPESNSTPNDFAEGEVFGMSWSSVVVFGRGEWRDGGGGGEEKKMVVE
ncbi:hypothetical protein RHGRI_003803 [Rhododendron griersonianum]|uniref:Uncharacterized protein n=1 Tax=Rhododendron griersonianum TaxID=479676 RepID=A0AAV6L8Z7_9ERIC|nr:hypothetical protein RHGRI_003803 [Rhododendron griersonianum]